MTPVWTLVRAWLRARRRALLGLALLVGVASGAVMVAAIGARRTDTAYARLLEATRAEDVEVEIGGFDDPRFIDRLGRLPQVADLGLESVALVTPDMPGDPPVFSSASARFVGVMSVDGRTGWTISRPLILAGRRPDPTRPEEIGLSESLARRWAVQPGDTVRLRALAPEQLTHALVGERVVPAGPTLALTVAAVQRLPDDLAVDPQAVEGFVSLTPAFYRTHRDRIAHFPPTPRIRLERGANQAAFAAAVRRLSGDSAEVSVIPRADLAQQVEQATRAQAVALALFAGLAAVAALMVIGQILTRELSLAAAGHDTVRALGASRPQLFAATMLPVVLVVALGGLMGAGIAVLASPLTPMGLARRAEPTPGSTVHLAGLSLGVLGTLVLLGGLVAVPAWRLTRARSGEADAAGRAGTASTAADAAARTGLPPTAVTGLRMALERGRGATAVPVRTTLVGVTAGIVALVAALTFAASLDRLLGTPRLYGWDFDAVAGDWSLDVPASDRPSWLTANPRVGAFSAAYFSRVLVGGTEVYAAGIDTAHGRVFPTIVEGREPGGPDEIVLGTRTMRRLERRLGQTVEVQAGRTVAMRIVGRSAFLVSGDEMNAGTGALLTVEGLRGLKPAAGSGYGVFYIRFAPGVDREAALDSLRHPSSRAEQDVELPRPPVDVENLGRVGDLPNVLAGLLALLAASALAHLLVTAVRRRRRDLAVLKTLGFARGQVSAAVAWQATTVAVIALAVGLPLGVALGRWSWSLLVGRIGLGAEPVTPWLALLAAATATVLVANLVAAWPGRMAARTRPALALRSE